MCMLLEETRTSVLIWTVWKNTQWKQTPGGKRLPLLSICKSTRISLVIIINHHGNQMTAREMCFVIGSVSEDAICPDILYFWL